MGVAEVVLGRIADGELVIIDGGMGSQLQAEGVPMDEAAREAYLDRIHDLLESHPDTRGRDELELDYVTTAWRMVPRR